MLYVQPLTFRKPSLTTNALTASQSLNKFKPSKTIWTLNLRSNPVKLTSINLSHQRLTTLKPAKETASCAPTDLKTSLNCPVIWMTAPLGLQTSIHTLLTKRCH